VLVSCNFVRRRDKLFQRINQTGRRNNAPRIDDELLQRRSRDTIKTDAEPPTAPLIPKSRFVRRYQCIQICTPALENDGAPIRRQSREDSISNAEIWATEVGTLDCSRKGESETSHDSVCNDPASCYDSLLSRHIVRSRCVRQRGRPNRHRMGRGDRREVRRHQSEVYS
jgi:hypothetical protein